jgi:carboxyl-terminal processing protease
MPAVSYHRRMFPGALLCVIAATFVGVSAAQIPLPEQDERQAIEAGVQLETSRQWRDAIDHYKKAVELWPGSDHLQYGLRRSKFHFGIDRRYTDESFGSELLEVSPSQCLVLFDEVLEKVRGHYVEPISTTWFVAHGTESLWLSLANQQFLQRNLFGADPEQLQEMRDILRQEYWNKRLRSQNEAHAMILQIADKANRLLGLDKSAVVMEFVFGGCNGLDDYSNYLTPARLRDLNSNIDGEFVGIGIVMEAEAGRGMVLLDVLPNSPALESGLRVGEYIVHVDGEDCPDLTTDEGANLLSGRSGSLVSLGIESGHSPEVRTVPCRRREVKVDSIPIKRMIDSGEGIGYIRMTGFQKSTPDEMEAALNQLSAEGMRSLIWDLRGNPGGLLTAAVHVCDQFIAEGRIVSTRGRTPDQNLSYSATRVGTWDLPLVVLIDDHSASASEIVAGAMKDHKRATLVGRKSFGKWSVQTIYPVAWTTGLRLTTAKFYSPNGHNWSNVGVEPDVSVALPDGADLRRGSTELDVQGDLDIRAAIQALRAPQYTRR